MTPPDKAKWTDHAVRFVALGDAEHLAKARDACDSDTICAFLQRNDLGQVPTNEYQPLLDSLRSKDRGLDAAMVEILALHEVAKAADCPEGLNPEVRQITAALCNRLASLSREHGLKAGEALFARTLGTRAAKQHEWRRAHGLLAHATGIYREFAEAEPRIYRPYVATTLNNLGTVLRNERDFPAARGAFEEALKIRREFAEAEPHIYRPHVAMTLNNLGAVLSNERDFPAARGAFEEALKIRRELAEAEPHIYRPYVATTLNNLGTVLDDERNFPAARGAFEEASGIYREFAEAEPHIYRPYVATTLNNLGNVLGNERDFPAARGAFEEASGIYRELAEAEPHIYRPYVATTLNNLGNVLEDAMESEAALDVSHEAIKAVKKSGFDPRLLWRVKGMIPAAYKRALAGLVSENDVAGSFRCLAAMREGQVLALDDDRVEPDMAAGALAGSGRKMCILVAQGLTQGRLLLGVLKTDGDPFLLAFADEFAVMAQCLFNEIQTVFDSTDVRNSAERRRAVEVLGAAAWKHLPDVIRRVLEPESGFDVLVSGDPYWTAFPWEALKHGNGEDDWLGVRRPLARWGPLSEKALSRLTPQTFGRDGERTAAVVCPWNASRGQRLPRAKAEAKEVARELLGHGYRLVPKDRRLSGVFATEAGMLDVLAHKPTVIHFTGHGGVFGNEEMLILSGGRRAAARPFGREHLRALRSAPEEDGPFLPNGPLVVLNACISGRAREFGGKREDLAQTFLDEGAAAIIASALPVYDQMGRVFAEALYRPGFECSTGMAWTFAAVRAVVERAARKSSVWAAWTLLAYHGNPYARLPHHAEAAEPVAAASASGFKRFFASLASLCGFRDASQAANEVERIRGRIVG